ncbi:phage DNA packaging protein J [Candidatus Micrarchaeota archaeon]|nr:phage DNA packaging protein J [Candidatus Micrarchaeota archaeon]
MLSFKLPILGKRKGYRLWYLPGEEKK